MKSGVGLILFVLGAWVTSTQAASYSFSVENRCQYFRQNRAQFDPRGLALAEVKKTILNVSDLSGWVESRIGVRLSADEILEAWWLDSNPAIARRHLLNLAKSAMKQRAQACLNDEISSLGSYDRNSTDLSTLVLAHRDLCLLGDQTQDCFARSDSLRLASLESKAFSSKNETELVSAWKRLLADFNPPARSVYCSQEDSQAIALFWNALLNAKSEFLSLKKINAALHERFSSEENIERAESRLEQTKEAIISVFDTFFEPNLNNGSSEKKAVKELRSRFDRLSFQVSPEYVSEHGSFDSRRNKITLSASYLFLSERQPGILNAIFSHELGHFFNPVLYPKLSHAMQAIYDQILTCFGSSFHFSREQSGEALADWWKAEAGAVLVKSDPSLIDGFISDFCLYDRGDYFDFEREHPHPFVRLSLIFGAHPAIHQILGGGANPPNWCGLEN